MLIFQKFDKFVKKTYIFDYNSKSLNSNKLAIVFPPALIFGLGFYLSEMSGYDCVKPGFQV